jgi:ribosomal protein S18 acetylase RimI-like enzyme
MWDGVVPEVRRRAELLAPIYDHIVRYGSSVGEVSVTNGRDAVAVWLPSERAQPSLWEEIRSGGLRIAGRLGPASLVRLMRFSAGLTSARQRVVPEPHRYLWVLGVRPEHQGRGLGTRLLEAGLAVSDGAGLPTYLETFSERCVAFYERYGFEVRQAAEMPPAGTRWWSMVRPV